MKESPRMIHGSPEPRGDAGHRRLLDRRGWPIPVQNTPEWKLGRTPANKGLVLPAEVLEPNDVVRFINSWDTASPYDIRQRAMLWLVYRGGLKMIDLVKLRVSDWNAGGRTLTLPANPNAAETRHAGRNRSVVRIDHVALPHLLMWVRVRAELGASPMFPLFFGIQSGSFGHPINASSIRGGLRNRGESLGLGKRTTIESLRLSGKRHAERQRAVNALLFDPYFEDLGLQLRFPKAHSRWSAAAELLAEDPERHGTRIGHDCREAMQDFAFELEQWFGPPSRESRTRTVQRIRAVLDANPSRSASVQAHLNALLSFWGTLSDLAQRQEHGATREREALTADDARRLVLQTLILMHELDDTLVRSGATHTTDIALTQSNA